MRNIFQCFFSQYFSTFSAACCQGIVVRRGDGWRCEAVGWRRRGGGGGDKKIFYFGLFTYHGNRYCFFFREKGRWGRRLENLLLGAFHISWKSIMFFFGEREGELGAGIEIYF